MSTWQVVWTITLRVQIWRHLRVEEPTLSRTEVRVHAIMAPQYSEILVFWASSFAVLSSFTVFPSIFLLKKIIMLRYIHSVDISTFTQWFIYTFIHAWWSIDGEMWQGIVTKKHILIWTAFEHKKIHINLPFTRSRKSKDVEIVGAGI